MLQYSNEHINDQSDGIDNTMTTHKQELMNQLVDLGVDLILHHDTRPSEITKAISKMLAEEAENLPRLEVLYNDTYGVYGYSTEFETFLSDKQKTTEEATSCHKMLHMPVNMPPFMTAGRCVYRITDCAHIRPFGKQQAAKYPIAFATVLYYYQLDLDRLKRYVHTLTYSGSKAEDREIAKTACEKLPKTLIDLCQDFKSERSSRYLYENSIMRQPDFSTFVSDNTDESEDIWKTQYHLDREIMMSLHVCLQEMDVCHRTGWESHLNEAYKMFGLICASGQSAKLAIATIPQIIEWTVHEYDGDETICFE